MLQLGNNFNSTRTGQSMTGTAVNVGQQIPWDESASPVWEAAIRARPGPAV